MDKLSLPASHALLKTLEEPLGDTLFILMSTQPKKLLATIRSRCFTLTMPSSHFQRDHSEAIAPLITSDPEKALALLYYKVSDCIKKNKDQEAFIFLDLIVEARKALALIPGLSKPLLLEPLLAEASRMKIC